VAEHGRRRPVTVSRAIFNTQGVKVIDAGVAVDERVYERLMQHQLAAPLEQSVGTAPAVDGAVLKQHAAELVARQPLFARMASATAASRERMLSAVESVPLPPPIGFQLTLMHELHPAQFRRSVACALVAVWLGDAPQTPRHDLAMLAAAALLRDLGMLHVDPVLMRRELPLQREHRRQLYAHPLVSAMLIERHRQYPQEVVRAVLEHHEALDGSGYPRSLDAATISPWGRIVALAELVSAQADAAGDGLEPAAFRAGARRAPARAARAEGR
jgi:HD-GYP domain-containing protein (c-di-GMP phosphodiesterase class II)